LTDSYILYLVYRTQRGCRTYKLKVATLSSVLFDRLYAHKISLMVQPKGFIHSVFCLTTGPKPLPKQCLHVVGS